MNKLEFLRGFVRPFSAYLLLTVLSAIAIYGFVKFADLEIYKIVIVAFLEVVSLVIGFWFGSRTKQSGDNK